MLRFVTATLGLLVFLQLHLATAAEGPGASLQAGHLWIRAVTAPSEYSFLVLETFLVEHRS
jgi:hypothetical protein